MEWAMLAVAVCSLGYGVYSSLEAESASKAAVAQSYQEYQQSRTDQTNQYNQQVAAEAAQNAQNLATEEQTQQDTTAAQTKALADEQAAIGTNSQTLSDSLTSQENQALTAQQPLIQEQLNSSGLAQSGAYAAQLAKYQASLASQAQGTISDYQLSADQQLNLDANADTSQQVQADEANAMTNIQSGQQDMSTNFQTQNVDTTNNTAYQQYITSLEAAKAQSESQQAAGYTSFGGQIGSGLLKYYYGDQNNSYGGYNSSVAALQNAGYGSSSDLGKSWNGMQY